MIEKVWLTLQEGENTYQHFSYLGRFPTHPVKDDFHFEMGRGALVNRYLPKSIFDQLNIMASDLVMTKTTVKHLDLSIRKADVVPVYDFIQNPYLYQTLDLVEERYGLQMVQPFMSHDELIGSMEMDRATGFIEAQCGYKKKSQWFAAGYYAEIYDDDVLQEVPLWKVAGKLETDERKSYTEELKQRTFIIQPVAHLLHTKRIYGHQNKALKEYLESAYGFNPYLGGVEKISRRLLKGRRFWELDGKRWDRKASWMKMVYNMRHKYLQDDKFRSWCAMHLINSHVVLPNGDLIFKTWGNNSGSGNTTIDNTLGMIIIIYLVFMTLSKGDPKVMSKVWFYVFGDDVIGSDCLDCSDEELRQAFVEVFGSFGVELDPLIIDHQLEGHNFLGFQFHCIDQGWVPQYPKGTICKSFLFQQHKMQSEGEISKMLSLLYMSAGNGKDFFDLIRHAFLQVLTNLGGEDDVELAKIIRKHGIPTYDDVIHWYFGFEGSSGVFRFLPSDWFEHYDSAHLI